MFSFLFIGKYFFSLQVCHFSSLPKWLQDNDFLHKGHRPPLRSFSACFRSIFRIHTETGNIWTHLLGKLNFSCLFIHMVIPAYFYFSAGRVIGREFNYFKYFYATAYFFYIVDNLCIMQK